MKENLSIKITQDALVDGSHPIVLIGPNGSGKSRHGVALAEWNNADIIAALRNIALNENVSMLPVQQAETGLRNLLNRRRSRPWELSNEIDQLFSKLIAEDSAAAIRFRDRFSLDKAAVPDETKLMLLSRTWLGLFPGRKIDFSTYSPQVESDYSGGGSTYPAGQMSDGERVALYLAARILDSQSRVIVVDEPEVHFHSRLAARFWNEMEAMRPECRFVYITHDLPFALSRPGAQFVIMRPNLSPQVVELAEGLPADVVESLLAAASFSIHAQRIVFCEGSEGDSLDQRLYAAWFFARDTAVVPVGSSRDVIRCATAFAESKLVAGLKAVGIIDRDYWPDAFREALPGSVTSLPVHEIENLLCSWEIFSGVARHLSVAGEIAKERYAEFIRKAAGTFTGGLLNKQISERFRRRCEYHFRSALNKLAVTDDLARMRAGHTAALRPDAWGVQPEDLFAEEATIVERALQGGGEDFLRVFPGKVFINHAAGALGISLDRYVSLIASALGAPVGSSLSQLREDIEPYLSRFLPSRRSEGSI
jgi:AAA domain, putative AbiEii toxin, Type IV TA system/Protein of unknown function (DUF4435)